MSNLSFGAGYWKKQLPLTVLSYLSSFIAIVTDLSLPLLTAAMLDYAVCYDPSKAAGDARRDIRFSLYGEIRGAGHYEAVFELCGGLSCHFIAAAYFYLYKKYKFSSARGLRMESDLRDDTYKKLMQLDGSALSGFNTGELMTVMNRDIVMGEGNVHAGVYFLFRQRDGNDRHVYFPFQHQPLDAAHSRGDFARAHLYADPLRKDDESHFHGRAPARTAISISPFRKISAA